jgi:sterol desaturase/sphingolipid hydroxylase (fatty acid hydroxylase superfamily)
MVPAELVLRVNENHTLRPRSTDRRDFDNLPGMLNEAHKGLRPLHGVQRFIAVGGFPMLITASVGGTIVMLNRGVVSDVAMGVAVIVSYSVLAIAERIWPWQRSWLHSRGDLRTDIGFGLINGLMTGLATPLVLVASVAVATALSATYGGNLWPVHWPLIAQLALGLVLAEFVEYSFHRAMHEVPWLWRFHATHHSAPRLYWLNAARFHPIDLFLVGVLKLAPLAVLGAGAPVFVLVNVFSAVHGAYQHANLPVRIGPLNWIFSMTELHRWHHSKRLEEANRNYGGNLILWDILFGTRYLPEDRDPPEEIGIESLPNFPMGLWANLNAPFRWRETVESSH